MKIFRAMLKDQPTSEDGASEVWSLDPNLRIFHWPPAGMDVYYIYFDSLSRFRPSRLFFILFFHAYSSSLYPLSSEYSVSNKFYF